MRSRASLEVFANSDSALRGRLGDTVVLSYDEDCQGTYRVRGIGARSSLKLFINPFGQSRNLRDELKIILISRDKK